MNGPGDELLAGARRAADERRNVAEHADAQHPPEDVNQLIAAPDDVELLHDFDDAAAFLAQAAGGVDRLHDRGGHGLGEGVRVCVERHAAEHDQHTQPLVERP